jgi:hypothetical protein
MKALSRLFRTAGFAGRADRQRSVEAGEQPQALGTRRAGLGRLKDQPLPFVLRQLQRFLGKRERADFGVVVGVGADGAGTVADVVAGRGSRTTNRARLNESPSSASWPSIAQPRSLAARMSVWRPITKAAPLVYESRINETPGRTFSGRPGAGRSAAGWPVRAGA